MEFGLNENTMNNICKVFLKYPQIKKRVLYGSRAKGNYKNGSDIDLCVMGNDISMQDINRIYMDLDNLNLPYTFDITNFEKLSNWDLIEHIIEVGKEIYAMLSRDYVRSCLKAPAPVKAPEAPEPVTEL